MNLEKKHNLKNESIVHSVDNQLQMIERDTCDLLLCKIF